VEIDIKHRAQGEEAGDFRRQRGQPGSQDHNLPASSLTLQSLEEFVHRSPYEKLSARNRLGVHEVFLRAEPFKQRLPFAEVQIAHVFRGQSRLPDFFVGPIQD
jgi:hypothetical protein